METLVINSEQQFFMNTVRITLLKNKNTQTYRFDTEQDAWEFYQQKKLQCPTSIYSLEIIPQK